MTKPKLLISGASGAIGNAFLAEWLRRQPTSEIVCIVRSASARDFISRSIGFYPNLKIVDCDLLSDDSTDAAAACIGRIRDIVAVHCAADVSWDKSADELYNLNVLGTKRFFQLAQAVTTSPRLVYVSTAFTNTIERQFRNGYEETKAAAELALLSTAIPFCTFSPSLVVGDSKSGRIARFNGIYPIVRYLTEYSPPFLVGKRDGALDVVPVDWVASQLCDLVVEQVRGCAPRNVVASSGPEKSISFESAVRLAEEEINKHRCDAGLVAAKPVPIIRPRQWEFLKRSLEAWRPSDLSLRDFRYFEKIMSVYSTYSEGGRARHPEGVSTPPPPPAEYLPNAVRYWLKGYARRLSPS